MYDVLLNFARLRKEKIERITRALNWLDQAAFLSRVQGYALAAVADHYRSDVILDLGTGPGNSAAVFSIARPGSTIYTFDLEDSWSQPARETFLPAGIGKNVRVMIGDLTKIDFAPLIGTNESILIFWDAHGFEVADHVLSHVMPLIADRKHIVVCHDMSHIRFLNNFDYEGRPFWRGLHAFGDWPGKTAYAVLGWTVFNVDQVIPIIDFCTRNEMQFRSFDADIHVDKKSSDIIMLAEALGLTRLDALHMGYFTMNATQHRRFPAPLSALAKI
jgi:predicted O-methyltransferase YrrM